MEEPLRSSVRKPSGSLWCTHVSFPSLVLMNSGKYSTKGKKEHQKA